MGDWMKAVSKNSRICYHLEVVTDGWRRIRAMKSKLPRIVRRNLVLLSTMALCWVAIFAWVIYLYESCPSKHGCYMGNGIALAPLGLPWILYLLLIDNSALTVMVSWLFVLSVFLNTVIIGVIVQWLARMLKLVKGKGGSG
jgi:hypothetical protein